MLVDCVDPLVGRLPDDGPDPQGEVGGHQVHEAEAGEQAEALDYNLGMKSYYNYGQAILAKDSLFEFFPS